ncbi:MAG: DEAD/DEAH box helicase [Sphaerochaetaceae bacterium]
MKFNELPLEKEILEGIEHASFETCMSVQEMVLPESLAQKDVMVQSKTGSGKTAVFLLTILHTFIKSVHNKDEKLPKALVIAPTRELAVQIEEDAILLSSGIKDFRIGCFYGGVGYQKQDRQLEKGVDLVIGTPGRILDYQKMGKINFKEFTTFVVDEADRLFDMGFYPDIQKMFTLMVEKTKRQTMIFSATLSNRVRNLAWSYMNNPVEIENQPEEITVNNITQELYHVSGSEKFSIMLRLLGRENPDNCLIFTNTKAKAVEITKRLQLNGYTVRYLMGDLPQQKRLKVINSMKSGDLKFLVATDVAARGLQIDDLQLVINYDIPEDFENYVHRIGRTARAGKSGKAITLACEEFVYGLEAIENYIQMKIPVIWIDETLPSVEDKSAGMRFRDLVDRSEYGPKTKRGSGPRRQSPQNRGPRPKAPAHKSPSQKNSGQPAKRAPQRKRPSQGKSFQEIQKMDLDERVKYYKKMYENDQTDAPAKRTEKKAPARKKGTPASTKQNGNSRPKAAQPGKQSVNTNKKPHPSSPAKDQRSPEMPARKEKKKGGILSRLFGRKNKNA